MQFSCKDNMRPLHFFGPKFYPESNHPMFQTLHSLRPGVRTLGTAAALTLALAGISIAAQAAPPVRPLHSFTGNDGVQPSNGLVVAPDGSLYGDTDYALGNTNHSITDVVFKTRPDGSGIQLLHTFPGTSSSGVNSDGSAPNRLVLVSGFLYGTTYTGGASGTGVIFKMDTTGGNFQILHTFGSNNAQNTDGAGAASGLTLGPDGALYGVTFTGGTGGGGGVYKINTDGSGFQVLYPFSSSNGGSTGYQPNSSPVFGSDGFLYGTTQSGGATGNGTVYKLTGGLALSVLHNFDSAGGFAPFGVIYGSDGNLYGTTFAGGPDSSVAGGTLFRLSLSGTYQVIHSFTTGTGQIAIPLTPPTEAPDGSLYGAANGGGTAGLGVIYQVSKDGSNFQVAGSLTQTTGVSVNGTLTIANRKVFGTAHGGGTSSDGTLFSLALPSVSHILWGNVSGESAFWTVQPDGSFQDNAHYGPYSGWSAKALADGPNGSAHLLWANTSGEAALWTVQPDGSFHDDAHYGPYSGWSAQGISAGPDGRFHLLWNHSSDGMMALWNFQTPGAPGGTYQNLQYGPYPNWQVKGVATGANNVTDLIWNNTDGTLAAWQVSEADGSIINHQYGPYAGGWTANAVAAGPDGLGLIAWSSASGTQTLWNEDFGSGSFTQVSYGPYSGWGVKSVAIGADGLSRLLWSHKGDNESALWLLDGAGGFSSVHYGPYAGWSVTALSAGQ